MRMSRAGTRATYFDAALKVFMRKEFTHSLQVPGQAGAMEENRPDTANF